MLNRRIPSRIPKRAIYSVVSVVSNLSTKLYVQLEVEVGFGLYDQVTKRTWWMPWRQKAMKDVVVCDKPRGVDNKL